MEVDDAVATRNRNNQKKNRSRRSSILKTEMSPVRMALGDLDPNQIKESTREAKSRRLSKRVSFADTLSVREFLNDNDAHTLGVWNSQDNEQQATPEVGDDEVVTGPTIQGLDSLLSAPIKDQTEQNALPASMVLQEDFQPKELTMTMDFTQTHGAILTELETNSTVQRSRSSSSETESDASIQHDIDVPNPTFVGPSYSCLMPASFSSSTTTEPGDSVFVAAEMEQTRVFQNDDTTGFMDLTNCYGGLMNSSTSEQKSQKTDTNSFLQSLIKPTQHKSNTSEFLRSLMTPKCDNGNLQSGHLPQVDTGITSYTKESSFPESKSCVDVNQLIQYRPDMEVVIPSTDIDKENQDHSILLAAKRSGAFELTDNKTRVFSNDDQGDMDMTECVPSNALSISQVGTEEGQSRSSHILTEDQTRMFTTEDAGLMEMTECVGNVLQASFSQDLKDKKVADQTVMFADGGDADMDETTPLGQIQLSNSSSESGHENYKPSFRNKSLSIIQEVEDENISRRNSSVINCTSTIDHKYMDKTTHGAFINDFTIGVDFTANVGQIIRPKYTSTPFQQTLSKSLCPKYDVSDKTSTVDITMCEQLKSENVLGQGITTSSQGEMNHESKSGKPFKGQAPEMPRNIGEETIKMELTSCVGGPMQESLGRTSGGFENRFSASEITRIFGSGGQTNRMELTSCVGGLLQQSSKIGQNNITTAAVMTPVDSIGEDTGKMELTSCVGGLVPTNQVKTQMSVRNIIPIVETTQVFGMGEETGRMDLTSGINGLLQRNQPKTPKCDRSKAPAADTTTIGMGEDTGKMELTSCVGEPVSTHQTLLSDRSKASVAETTHLFGRTEDTGRMEFTTCVGGLHMSDGSKADAAETTVFGMREHTGRMELTSCVGGLVQTNEAKPSNNIEIPAAEITRVFGIGDDTGMMELTSCIGGLVPKNQGKTPISDRSKGITGETTVVFGMGEDTGKMDLTSCIGGLAQRNQGKTPISRKTPAAEMTRVYGIGDDTGMMELTSCLGGLVPKNQEKTPISDKSKGITGETTTVFGMGEDTGKMDLTSCIGGLTQTNQGKTPIIRKTPAAEMTRVYGIGDDTGMMELTSCLGGLVPKNQEKTPISDKSKGITGETTVFGMGEDTGKMDLTSCIGGLTQTNQGKTPIIRKTPAAEMTRVYGIGDDTGMMELTSCLGGLVPKNQEKTPISDKSKGITGETTAVFGMGEDTGKMDLTSCIGGLAQTNQGKTPISRKTPAAEMTRVYGIGDDTGMMELTSCLGGLVPKNQEKTPISDRSKGITGETTVVFGMGEDTGKMDLTSCIGGLAQTNQGKTPISRKTPATEMTRVFGIGDDTGRMELTSCVSSLVPTSFVSELQKTTQEKMPESDRCKMPAAETTKLFSIGEDTGRIELTSCVEGVLQLHNESSQAAIDRKDSVPEITAVFGLEKESDKMELTCVDNHLQQCEVVESEGEAPAAMIQDTESEKIGLPSDISNFEKNKKIDIINTHAQIPDMIHQNNISQIADLGTRTLETEMMNKNSAKAFQELSSCIANQSMSVPVAENMAGFEYSEVSSIGIDILGTDDKDRSAGTFTIIKGEDADTFTIAGESESCRQEECPQEGVPGSKRKQEEMDCLASLPQSKLLKTDLHDTGVAQEKEECTKGILEELPPYEIEELENLDLTAATTFHENEASKCRPSGSSDEDGSQKASLSKSILDRTVMDNFSFLDTAKSAGSEITVGEFLEKFLCANLTSLPPATNDRRSLMPVLQRSEPNDLASCLRSLCIDTPKCQMYEWAVEYVSQNIERMELSVLELTEKLYHKEEMKKKMIIGSAEMKGFEKRVQKLHQVCRKGTKTSWKEWKTKMLSSILTSVTERHDHLKKTVESISESVTQIDSDMQELEKYEADLDTAISDLESLELPDEDQQQLYIEQQGKISQLERELEGMQENQTTLQKEYELLVKEEERVQNELQDLEEKRNKVEEVDNVAENLQTAYNKCKRIERLCEGKVKEWDDASCAVAFLYDSLWLRVTYGGAVPSDLRERVVSSVQFESYLENSSAPSAHLSHVMMQEAVDCKALLQKYPTTNSLPKMLEELSYIACHARCLERDIRHVQFWHPVEIHKNKVEVEFSNFRAFAKFYITFEFVPGSYPTAPVKFTFTNKIGEVSEGDINTVLASVRPGYCYFKRLVQAVDTFIEQRSINVDDSDGS